MRARILNISYRKGTPSMEDDAAASRGTCLTLRRMPRWQVRIGN